jgi:hypothetical protein
VGYNNLRDDPSIFPIKITIKKQPISVGEILKKQCHRVISTYYLIPIEFKCHEIP